MSVSNKPSIFISYSHKDEHWKDRLVTHLEVSQQLGIVELWDDRRIEAGEDWYRAIVEAIDAGSIAILLVSTNSLTSKFILSQEVPRLLKRRDEEGLRLFPIILEPCDWDGVGWLKRMQLRPKDGKPLSRGRRHRIETELTALAREIRLLLPSLPKVDTPERVSTTRLYSGTGGQLFGRDEELNLLDEAWGGRKTNVLSVVAWAGVGKSALVNCWLARMAVEDYRGAERVYGWSFYDPGMAGSAVSAEQFVEKALTWFGDRDPRPRTAWEKGERLAQLVGAQRTLLVLDGLEPLQHPPGPDEGHLKDQALHALLRGLAAQNRGLCVISTRVAIAGIRSFEGNTHTRIDLEYLSPKAGAQLLRAMSVKGKENELRRASGEFGGHSLALTLLGSYLSDACGGAVSRRREVRSLEDDVRHGGHAKRVMESYVECFGEGPELNVLHMLGLFNRPADRESIAVLRAAPPIRGLTDKLFYRQRWKWLTPLLTLLSFKRTYKPLSEKDWGRVLIRLRRAKLIADEQPKQAEGEFAQTDPPDIYPLDTHPLVREHFRDRLKMKHPDAWREGNARLFKYLRDKVVLLLPEAKDDILLLYAAVTHGCHAGEHKSAFGWVYYTRIQRTQRFFSANRIAGSVNADLDALSCFFPNGWGENPLTDLEYPLRALLLGQAGYRLWMVGKLEEAVTPMKKAREADKQAAEESQKDRDKREAWKYASIDADTLAGIYLALGNLPEAFKYSEQGVEFACASADINQMVSTRNTKGDIQHHMGKWREAEKTFREAEDIQNNHHPAAGNKKSRKKSHPSFHNPLGYRHCDLLLSLGRYAEALERLESILKYQREEPNNFNLIDIALNHLLLGRAQLAQVAGRDAQNFDQVKASLDLAMSYLLHAGRVVHFPRGLMALADWHLIDGTFKHAMTNLQEALDIATLGKMRVHQSDCLLKFALVYLAQGKKAKARESWERAKGMIEEMGYHRRDKEVQEIEEQLKAAGG